MKASDFYTVPRSEAGVKVPVSRPDGTDSGEWLLVIGPDSKAFAKALADLNRSITEFNATYDAQKSQSSPELLEEMISARDAAAAAAMEDYVAKLIIGWSFDDEFNDANLRAFIANCPALAVQVPNFATDRARFFGPASPASTPGQTSNGDSAAAVQPAPQSA